MTPEIKLIACSNVYSRLMHFKRAGDIELGHRHSYNHATLISAGSVQVDILDEESNTTSSKVFNAPTMIYISKDDFHKITALEDDTVCVCIHALRTIDEELVEPDFLVDAITNDNNDMNIPELVKAKTDKTLQGFIVERNKLVDEDLKH